MSGQSQPTPSTHVTTDQIMDFLVENMSTKAELDDLRKEVKDDIASIRKEMVTKEDLKFEIGEIKKVMVTKDDLGRHRSEMIDFIDKRLLNLKTDLVVIVKGEDQKPTALIELMKKKEMLTPHEAQGLLQMNPLAQVA